MKYLITGQWNYLSPFIGAIIDIFPRTNGIVHQAYLVGSELLIQFSCPSYHVSLQGLLYKVKVRLAGCCVQCTPL